MKILLIDADSTIPCIPLMKLSTYHKSVGDDVEIVCLKLSYYPNRKNKVFTAPAGYDKVYCCCIFTGTKDFVRGDNIIYGGTGIDLITKLPLYIDELELDYSIYPENDTSYGFLSRGCNRKCYFCVVPEKEGKIHLSQGIEDVIKHKKVEFLDNNFLQLSNHKQLLRVLVGLGVKCRFMQGLDIRMIDEENSLLLSQLNYIGEYIFAFDSVRYVREIERQLKLMGWRKDWKLKFYVYVHPDMSIGETTYRLSWLKERKCLPYLMRDLSCWASENSDFYIDLAAWVNQPGFFKNLTFEQFLYKRCKGKNSRYEKSLKLYNEPFEVTTKPGLKDIGVKVVDNSSNVLNNVGLLYIINLIRRNTMAFSEVV